MEEAVVIRVENLTKTYKLYEKPIDRLKEAIHPFGKKYHKKFDAVHRVSFKVRKGETVGIVGRNGSGKSTLLKMITGVITPSEGVIEVKGKLSALLELGAGFHPEYSGIKNIFLIGTMYGYNRREMESRLDEIVRFADIGDFIHQPVKTYSSGMFIRLAFAVAINVDPDILVIDEALSVGDMRFQQKCFRKMEEFRKSKTILLVSHDINAIVNYCDRAIWMNDGRIVDEGHPKEVTKKYQAYMTGSTLVRYIESKANKWVEEKETLGEEIDCIPNNVDVHGDGKAKIVGISMLDAKTKEKIAVVDPGQSIDVILKIQANEYIKNPIVGLTLKDRIGNIVTQCNSFVIGKKLEDLTKNSISVFRFTFTMPNLNKGVYTISPAIASGTQEEHVQHCWVHDALIFQVLGKNKRYHLQGYLFLDDVECEKICERMGVET